MIGLINDLPKDKKVPRVMLKTALRLKLALALKTAEAAGRDGVLQKIILLTMPVLSLHLNILGSIKNNITKGHKACTWQGRSR